MSLHIVSVFVPHEGRDAVRASRHLSSSQQILKVLRIPLNAAVSSMETVSCYLLICFQLMNYMFINLLLG